MQSEQILKTFRCIRCACSINNMPKSYIQEHLVKRHGLMPEQAAEEMTPKKKKAKQIGTVRLRPTRKMRRRKLEEKVLKLQRQLDSARQVVEEQKRRLKAVKARAQPLRPPHPFYDSQEWRALKYRALTTYGRRCALCQTTSGVMHVDHIKPRSRFPELALSFDNLQILCQSCNMGKGNTDTRDFRAHVNPSLSPTL
jgi:5-methylcytosine-specific restriction endonuclease McrA